MRSVVMDGNFSAQHRPMKNPQDDVPLADGHLFTVEDAPYKAHLETAKEFAEVTYAIYNHPLSPTITPIVGAGMSRTQSGLNLVLEAREIRSHWSWCRRLFKTWLLHSTYLCGFSARGGVSVRIPDGRGNG